MGKQRKLDKCILKVLDEYRGILLSYTDIREELEERNIGHTDVSLSKNLQFLRKENMVWYFEAYGVPAITSDGLWFILDYDGHLFINPTEDMSDIVKEFRIHIEKYFKTNRKLHKSVIHARDNLIKKGFPKSIRDKLVLESGWTLERLLRFYPWIGMAKVVIEKGLLTLEQCAEAMDLPLESLEEIIKDYCGAKKFGENESKKMKSKSKEVENSGNQDN